MSAKSLIVNYKICDEVEHKLNVFFCCFIILGE